MVDYESRTLAIDVFFYLLIFVLGLNRGRGRLLNFLGAPMGNDFITQKVYLPLMRVYQ
jgi:hypothetical protein